jgi:hypothetical protein
VAEWFERLRCDHSEAVWAGSACDFKESSVLGIKLAGTGDSGIQEVRSDLHRLDTRRFANLPDLRVLATQGKYRAFQSSPLLEALWLFELGSHPAQCRPA